MPGIGVGSRHLGGEVGVAAGVLPQPGGAFRAEPRHQVVDQLGGRRAVEGTEDDRVGQRPQPDVAEQLEEGGMPATGRVAVDHDDAGAGGEASGHVPQQPGAGPVQALAVLDDQEHRPLGGHPCEQGSHRGVRRGVAVTEERLRLTRAGGAEDPLQWLPRRRRLVQDRLHGRARAKRVGDGVVRRVRTVAPADEHGRALVHGGPHEPRDEPGLADPRLAGDEHQPPGAVVAHCAPRRLESCLLDLPPDLRRLGQGCQHRVLNGVLRWAPRPVLRLDRFQDQGRVLAEDGLRQPLELRTGVEPQLVGEPLPRLGVHGQGVRLSAGAVQREHQLAGESLSERMGGDQ